MPIQKKSENKGATKGKTYTNPDALALATAGKLAYRDAKIAEWEFLKNGVGTREEIDAMLNAARATLAEADKIETESVLAEASTAV